MINPLLPLLFYRFAPIGNKSVDSLQFSCNADGNWVNDDMTNIEAGLESFVPDCIGMVYIYDNAHMKGMKQVFID